MFERLYGPIGAERFDYLFAQLQATIANANRDRRSRPFKAKQFAPPWADVQGWPWQDRPNGPQSPQDMLDAVRKMNKAMGGN